MARGKHLFPCRTQQLSLVAVTILGVHPWENSTVPNYKKDFLTEVLFLYKVRTVLFSRKKMIENSRFGNALPNLGVPNYKKDFLTEVLFLYIVRTVQFT